MELKELSQDLIKVISKIEALDWNVSIYDNNKYVELQKYSPAGQDFIATIEIGDNADDFINNIYEYYESFDVSYETYLWLDSCGHGKNGAPYDMRDLYNDMEVCEQYIYQLYRELNK